MMSMLLGIQCASGKIQILALVIIFPRKIEIQESSFNVSRTLALSALNIRVMGPTVSPVSWNLKAVVGMENPLWKSMDRIRSTRLLVLLEEDINLKLSLRLFLKVKDTTDAKRWTEKITALNVSRDTMSRLLIG